MNEYFDQQRYLIPFRSTLLPQIFTETLVIGSGVAGLRSALALVGQGVEDVVVLAKAEAGASNTAWAQGGVAAVMDSSDSFEAHVNDTLKAGGDLCDRPITEQIIQQAPKAMADLMDWQMAFDRDPQTNAPCLGREGGHTARRILHADGDATGAALVKTLLSEVDGREGIRLFEHCFAVDLLTDQGRCVGALTYHPKYGLQMIWAKAVLLASGGCGQVYRETTNPTVATGDGLAMAWRAGVALGDLSFMQFHPTTLYIAGASRSLITEAVRGEGAYLVNRQGERFMVGEHELAELAPRDIVARAILRQLSHRPNERVYLDARHLEHFKTRFPGISALLADFDIDPSEKLIPIRPAAHYMIGGCWVDQQGATNLTGLYAAGEVSCTGLHGANRLASNSLLEGLVSGEQTARAMAEFVAKQPQAIVPRIESTVASLDHERPIDMSDVRSTLRSVMWRHVGIERDGERLDEVMEMFDFWGRYTLGTTFDDPAGWEVQNLLIVGALITRAAVTRTESRGTQFRIDYPTPDPEQRCHRLWVRGQPEPIERPVLSSSSD